MLVRLACALWRIGTQKSQVITFFSTWFTTTLSWIMMWASRFSNLCVFCFLVWHIRLLHIMYGHSPRPLHCDHASHLLFSFLFYMESFHNFLEAMFLWAIVEPLWLVALIATAMWWKSWWTFAYWSELLKHCVEHIFFDNPLPSMVLDIKNNICSYLFLVLPPWLHHGSICMTTGVPLWCS